jgi:hypothetical protein
MSNNQTIEQFTKDNPMQASIITKYIDLKMETKIYKSFIANNPSQTEVNKDLQKDVQKNQIQIDAMRESFDFLAEVDQELGY